MTQKTIRPNERNLMNILKKCQEEDPSIVSDSPSPVTTSSKYQSLSYNSNESNDNLLQQLNEASQASSIKPKKRHHAKGQALKKRQIQNELPKDINIDNVGEAAEWLEKGTRSARQQQNEEDFNDQRHIPISLTQTSVRENMQRKAEQIMNGTYKQPRNPTSQDLMNKAKKLRESSSLSMRNPGVFGSSQPISPVRSPNRVGLASAIIPSSTAPAVLIPAQSNSAVLQLPNLVEDSDSKWQLINQSTIQQKNKQGAARKKDYTNKQVTDYYMNMDVTAEKKSVELEVVEDAKDQGILGIFKACFGMKSKSEMKIRLQLLSLAKVQMGSDEDAYILQVIWKTLRNSKYNRYGMHWEDVGFQGRDPATDLRGTGVLSLFQIFQFIERHLNDFKNLYLNSVDSSSQFPFAISFVKITGTFIRLLKQDKLPAQNLSQYLDWFCAISIFVLQKLAKQKFDVTQFGQTLTKMLDDIDSGLDKILKLYKARQQK